MKYMLLIYDNPDTRETFLGEEGEALMAEVDAIMKELTESGELVGGEALADPSNTQDGPVRDGVPAITDGPFVEAKEHLAGYLIVDCESAERATEIAARWPERALSRDGGAAGHGHRRRGDVSAPTTASRTCCASWRRRSSARSSAATGTSTRARTRCRRRCSPPPSQWPDEGVPDNPRGWLITVASRRLTDQLRSEQARRRREDDRRRAWRRRRGRRAGAGDEQAARPRTTR